MTASTQTDTAKHLTLVYRITSPAQQTRLLAEGQWIASCHTDAMAERDALRNEVAQLEPLLQEAAAIARENRSRVVELEVENARLQQMLDAVGAGGVEPLRKRECLHQIAEPLEHDEDWLEQMYWEFDESRQKSGDERLRFKGFMRAYGTKCAHGIANLAQMEPCEDDEDESPRQIAAPQPPTNGLESLPAMAREIFCNYPTKTQKEIDPVASASPVVHGGV